MNGSARENAANPITDFLIALQFLTVSPAFIRRIFTPRELGRAVAFFPLVGLLLGAFLTGLQALLQLIFPTPLTAAALLTAWIAITGALHFDGFLDAMDGIFGGSTPEKRLEIMKDERVGAFAFAGGSLLLLLKFTALLSLPGNWPALLLAPTAGRWIITLAIVLFPYGRTQGLGRAMKDHAGPFGLLIATITTLLVTWTAATWWGLISLLVALLLICGLLFYVLRRIPGLTGDIYGAVCELTELILLLSLSLQIS